MSSRSTTFYLGLVSGLAVGAVTALLYAPDTGKNTRDKISYRLSHYVDELTELLEKLRMEKATISEAKQKGQLVVEEAQQRANDLKREVDELLTKVSKSV